MQNQDEHAIKQLTRVLFDKARRLTQNDRDRTWDLVQEVWCKVMTHKNLGQEKLNTPYLTQTLKNHFYDKQNLNGKVEQAMPEDAEVQDDTQTEEYLVNALDSNGTDHQVEQVWEYLEQHKDGWILQELVNKNCDLKTLSQYKGMNYENLRKKRFRLLKELKVKLRGVTPQNLLYDWIQKVFCPVFGRISLYKYKPKKIRAMKHLSLIFVLLPFLFSACSENSEMNSAPKDNNSSVQKSESEPDYLTWTEVKNDLENAGAQEVAEPSNFEPSFEGYESIKHYSKPGESDVYHVYIFSGPDDPHYGDAMEICPLDWGNTGLCGDPGEQCRFEDKDGDGDLEIVCCGDDSNNT